MISSAHLNAFGEPTGDGSEVVVPVFVSQSGFLDTPSIPDCRAGSVQHDACPPVQLPGSQTGARAGDPLHASPCYLIHRSNGQELRIPLMFIPNHADKNTSQS